MIADENGYIWGRIHTGRDIAIYIKDDIEIQSPYIRL